MRTLAFPRYCTYLLLVWVYFIMVLYWTGLDGTGSSKVCTELRSTTVVSVRVPCMGYSTKAYLLSVVLEDWQDWYITVQYTLYSNKK